MVNGPLDWAEMKAESPEVVVADQYDIGVNLGSIRSYVREGGGLESGCELSSGHCWRGQYKQVEGTLFESVVGRKKPPLRCRRRKLAAWRLPTQGRLCSRCVVAADTRKWVFVYRHRGKTEEGLDEGRW